MALRDALLGAFWITTNSDANGIVSVSSLLRPLTVQLRAI